MLKTISFIGLISLLTLITKFYTQDSITFGVKSQNKVNQEIVLNNFTNQWDAILTEYVDSEGKVAYFALKNESERLNKILNDLGSLQIQTLSGKQKLATHINLYNFLTVFGIVHFYPLNSILDKVSVGGFNFWKDMYFQFYDAKLSLDQIEHSILRKMNEPRIHFAIVCASISCPILLNKAFRSNTLELQLRNQTNLFLSNPLNIVWDHNAKSVRLSAIFTWFRNDFGSSDKEVLSFIRNYLPKDVKNNLSNIAEYSIGPELSYDWNLNEQSN